MDTCITIIKTSVRPTTQAPDHKPAPCMPKLSCRAPMKTTGDCLAKGAIGCGLLTFVSATACFSLASTVVSHPTVRTLLAVPVLVSASGAGILLWKSMKKEEPLEAIRALLAKPKPATAQGNEDSTSSEIISLSLTDSEVTSLSSSESDSIPDSSTDSSAISSADSSDGHDSEST